MSNGFNSDRMMRDTPYTQRRKVLFVSIRSDWTQKVRNYFRPIDSIQFLPVDSTLMAAFSTVEDTHPDLVVIDGGFLILPEYQGFEKLLKMLTIDVIVANSGNSAAQTPSPTYANGRDLISDGPKQVAASIATALDSNRPPYKTQIDESDTRNSLREPFVMLGISTGGVDALAFILNQYTNLCPPTLIVQHTGQEFGTGLVNLLATSCPANVQRAAGSMPMVKGRVYVAAGGDQHLALSPTAGPKAEMLRGEKVEGHLPSIDVLFKSAVNHAPYCVAGLLTGMGRDGANGLLALRNAGARTFAQDPESSVVYGMPRVAWMNGGAERQIGLKDVPGHIYEMIKQIKTGASRHGI